MSGRGKGGKGLGKNYAAVQAKKEDKVAKIYARLTTMEDSPSKESTKIKRMAKMLDALLEKEGEDVISDIMARAQDENKNTVEEACVAAMKKGWATFFPRTESCRLCSGAGECGGSQCDDCMCACGQMKVECGGC